ESLDCLGATLITALMGEISVFRPFQAKCASSLAAEATMCGIVGAIAERDVVPILMEGLRRLEYRGYDSAGLAVLNGSKHLTRLRTVGEVHMLDAALEPTPTRISRAMGSPSCTTALSRTTGRCAPIWSAAAIASPLKRTPRSSRIAS